MNMLYFLKKNGMYYSHDSCGYVSNFTQAEVYYERFAKFETKRCKEVTAIPITDVIQNSKEIQEYIDRLEAMKNVVQNFKKPKVPNAVYPNT